MHIHYSLEELILAYVIFEIFIKNRDYLQGFDQIPLLNFSGIADVGNEHLHSTAAKLGYYCSPKAPDLLTSNAVQRVGRTEFAPSN